MNKNIDIRSDQHWGADGSPRYRSGLAYLLIGGGIGATIALLFAPKPGSQLRGDVVGATRKGFDKAKGKARELNQKSSEFAHTVKEKTNTALSFATGRESHSTLEPDNTAGGPSQEFGGTLNPG